MFKIEREEIQWGDRTLSIETGKIARQADGSVVVRYGDTTVLCTLVSSKKAAPDADFFPLAIFYQEKAFAAGKIPGGFFKRETKPSEREVLTSRLIDRPMRPLFAKNFKNDTQVICTVLSFDGKNSGDIPAMIGAAATASISGVPFNGPLAGARVAYKGGKFILNPTLQDLDQTELDLVVAGTKDSVLMVESEAKELSEEQLLEAVTFGHKEFQPVIEMIERLAKKTNKTPWEKPQEPEVNKDLEKELQKNFKKEIEAAYQNKDKADRCDALNKLRDNLKESLSDREDQIPLACSLFKSLEEDLVRGMVLKTSKRIDGRKLDEVRPITCEVDFLPYTHGSSVFTRGETQALVVTTLGTGQDEQIIDDIQGEYREPFMLHYNFPPFSVGETGRLGAPGRREIGHGKLAWRALKPILPKQPEFPYTIRMVSDITESNGSSSMATVCGCSLAMMDAGVPIKNPVAGIAMGLVKEKEDYAILSDILGDEDHLGDMDFKVAGTKEGITALQMDLKITSIDRDIMQKALEQARKGRLHILGEMQKTLESSRESLNAYAPKIELLHIPKDRIGEVIGPGGKIIREIIEKTNTKVDIEEDGTVKVAGVNKDAVNEAIAWIKGLVEVPEVGKTYTGKVTKTTDFGAFVSFLGNASGLIHISEIEPTRIDKVTDYINVGDEVTFKVTGIDDRGKLRLSRKACL